MDTSNLDIVVRMKFGSHVYGTNLPCSDYDFKTIFLPSSRDILLLNSKDSYSISTGNSERKNTNEDIDEEFYSLKKFLTMLSQGQTPALDMLFTPDQFILETSPIWEELRSNTHKLIHKNSTYFVRYCRAQANKFGTKGQRISILDEVLNFLEKKNPDEKLEFFWDELVDQFHGKEHINFPKLVVSKNMENIIIPHFEVCSRKFDRFSKVGYVYPVLKKIYDGYGHRAKTAARNEGKDWKALMHALKICDEAKELLQTGRITFPRENSSFLKDVRLGNIDYQQVIDKLDRSVDELEETIEYSKIPDHVDQKWIENFLIHINLKKVLSEANSLEDVQ